MSEHAPATLRLERPAPYVLLVALARPRNRNALNKQVFAELAQVLATAEGDDAVRCVVLTGDDVAFSAGADIKEMPTSAMPPFVDPKRVRDWNTVEHFTKPMIAAVNGYALGAGCELMLLCDIAIAGENATIGTPEIKIAAFPGAGGSQRLPREIGKVRAMRMILTGDPIDAATALAWGLVAEVTPVAQTVARAVAIASRIAEHSPIAARLAKEDVLMSFQKPLEVANSLERKMLLWQTEDHDEGIAAFVAKRKPAWKGR
jgi:enoyl-CoA hydratase